MTITSFARAALVAGAVTGASIGLAGNACATPLVAAAPVTACGQWSKNADGSAQFEVAKTDQLPGLAPPAEAPLPGYNVALVASESSTTKSGAMKVLPWVALAAGGLGLGSVGGALLIGRCRRARGSQR